MTNGDNGMTKLVVIMSIEEAAEPIRKLLTAAGVLVFSELAMTGFRKLPAGGERDNWFAHATHATYSHLIFTVVPAGKAEELLAAIRKESGAPGNASPIHAMLMNVEQFI
jgi:hypothetical protein